MTTVCQAETWQHQMKRHCQGLMTFDQILDEAVGTFGEWFQPLMLGLAFFLPRAQRRRRRRRNQQQLFGRR